MRFGLKVEIASPRHQESQQNQPLGDSWRNTGRSGVIAGLLLAAAGAVQAVEPIGCILPDWCGFEGMPACQIDCAPLGEFQWMRYCPGHLSDGYVSHQAFGGHHAYRLRTEANGDMTFITSSDQGFYDEAESPTCGDWGLHLR